MNNNANNEQKLKDELRQSLEKELPPIIAREEVHKYTGGIYSSTTMSVIDCKGNGPKRKMRVEGRKIAYFKQDLIDWIVNRITFL